MEDAHSFVYNFGGVYGQGFFSIFDGHAGKHAAEWCGENFHQYLIKAVLANGKQPVPDLLNSTFHSVDARLSELAREQGSSSGCTAVTCFLRLEDDDGTPVAYPETGGINPQTDRQSSNHTSDPNSQAATSTLPSDPSTPPSSSAQNAASGASSSQTPSTKSSSNDLSDSANVSQRGHSHSGSRSGNLLSSLTKRIRKASGGSSSPDESSDSPSSSPSKAASGLPDQQSAGTAKGTETRPIGSATEGLVQVSSSRKVRRVLYTANVGDARAVLCRRGHAVRLTYDHKASDAQEAKRITDAGGFVMNNRVNAVLAVTRSLGDSAMKEFVVGAPYTTETTLTDEDTFLIVACDGLWDVVEDQDAVDLVREAIDPQEAANRLLAHALRNFSTDNTSVMVIRFNIDGDAYCASAATNKKASQPPTSKVHGSHLGQSEPTVGGQSTTAQGTTTTVDAPPSESVASSNVSNSAQAGGSSGEISASNDNSTASNAKSTSEPIQHVTSNESNASTVSNAGSGAS